MAGAAVTFLSVTLTHAILRLRVAREIIGFLSVTDTYIQTISEMRRRISCLALRCSATMYYWCSRKSYSNQDKAGIKGNLVLLV